MNEASVNGVWSVHADLLQNSIGILYGAPWPQYLHNIAPFEGGDDDSTFNYWWLAHLIDCRLDAYRRSGDPMRLNQAEEAWRNIVDRNSGQLFNDYFDDMLWFALATLRLWEASGDDCYLESTRQLWDHIVDNGWNSTMGESLAWRKQQLYYKNTPANGPLIILGARLYRITGEERYLDYARRAFVWIETNLRGTDGFVEDGINRQKDGKVDTQWRFTYNQGLYIGAAVELQACGIDGDLLGEAIRTATTAIRELSDGEVFHDEGTGGDEGLFKGVYYRYVGLLIDCLHDGGGEYSESHDQLVDFVRRGTDTMWRNATTQSDGAVLVGNDWSSIPSGRIYYSTMLSAVMAAELRASLER